MTARGIHAGEHAPDAEDLDVEEVLALVNEGSTGSCDSAVPPPSTSPAHPPQGTPRKPDTDQHKATPGPRPVRSPAAPHAPVPAERLSPCPSTPPSALSWPRRSSP